MEDYEWFKNKVLALTEINLDLYKEAQMKRRINTFIGRCGRKGYADYAELISNDTAQLEAFKDFITINVTEFFRDPGHWDELERLAIPNLIERFGAELFVWSSACSTGEEAYSLAMLLSSYMPLDRIHVLGTDISECALEVAKRGVYSPLQAAGIPRKYLERFFSETGDGFEASEELKACVTFEKLDLLKDPYPKPCHLIVCRNVLIYFTPAAKEHIYAGFKNSMLPGSCAFFGRAEHIANWKRAGYDRLSACIYLNR